MASILIERDREETEEEGRVRRAIFNAFISNKFDWSPYVFYSHELVQCSDKSFYIRQLHDPTAPKNLSIPPYMMNKHMLKGTMFHEHLPKIAPLMVDPKEIEGYELEKTISYKDIKVVFHCDLLTTDCAWEFKFTSIYLAYIKNSSIDKWLPQSNGYAVVFCKPKSKLVLVDKEDFRTRIWEMQRINSGLKGLLERAYQMSVCFRIGKKLDEEKPLHYNECDNCNYNMICENAKRQKKEP